ncbi:MAG: hypothetical protein IJI44_03955 [Erysipelotrichaceae bacterium]|nr:hypothetical protein [Erysipelotrichaceae bacterium]
MTRRKNRRNGLKTVIVEKRKQTENPSLTDMLKIAIITTAAVYFLLFSVPRILYAYSGSDARIDFEQTYHAEKLLYGYMDTSLDFFDEYEEEPELIENILPYPIYHSVSNYYMYSGVYSLGSLPARKAWAHAYDLARQGLIHGASTGYQCTFFAQMWFYDIYGFNSSGNGGSGDGKNFAYKVYQTHTYRNEEGKLCHWFELGKEPKTMGIISISGIANENGHVICVDEVDYANDMITFSDGNYMNKGEVRIRVTMSLSEFYRTNPGRYTFVNPTLELLETLKEN